MTTTHPATPGPETTPRDARVLSLAKIIARPGLRVALRLNLHAIRSVRQAARMPGCLMAVAAPTGDDAAFAVSLWEDEASLRAFVRSGAHANAAVQVRDLARAHVTRHLPWRHDTIPPWTEWGDLLADDPHIINTRHVGDLTETQKLAGPRRWRRFPPPLRARGRRVSSS